mmetsp:Transcript_88852/g.240911  ORF Transcript_88852/g.240911 Transcript_88852/m.240911 type:complete len:260 (+) Transcript_88852:89-868(+)
MALAAVLAAALLAAASGADSEVQVGPAGSVTGLMRRAARPHAAAPARGAGPEEGGQAEVTILQGGGADGARSAVASSSGGAVFAAVRAAGGANASGAPPAGEHAESSVGGWLALNISDDGTLLARGSGWGHGSTVALIGGHSRKFCADEGHTIKCNRDKVGKWEKFYIHSAGGGKWALRGGRHNKWCADEGGRIKCNRVRIGGWEKFTIGGTIPGQDFARTLRGGRWNRFCADEKDKGIKCNRKREGAWERFDIVVKPA